MVQKLTLQHLFRATFAKVAVLTYVMGTVVHLTLLFTHLPGTQMPSIAHVMVTFMAGYAALGFVVFAKQVVFRNRYDKIMYGLVTVHLAISALMHAYSMVFDTNNWLEVFPYAYSFVAAAYFIAFGTYAFFLHKRFSKT